MLISTKSKGCGLVITLGDVTRKIFFVNDNERRTARNQYEKLGIKCKNLVVRSKIKTPDYKLPGLCFISSHAPYEELI